MFDTFLNSTISVGPLVLAVLVLVVCALTALGVVVVQLGTRLKNLTYPVYDQTVKEAQVRANTILEEAEEQSRAIRAKAHMEAGKVLADRKKEDQKLREEHIKQVEEITVNAKEALNTQIATIHKLAEDVATEFKKYSEQARSALNEESGMIQQVAASETERIKASLSELSAQTEKEFEALIAENRKLVKEELEHEIEQVREVIEAYKRDRFHMLDQRIVALVEDTARITLNKTLTLDEHNDVVLASLAEAKQEGIFGK